jgi:hypothetical protein
VVLVEVVTTAELLTAIGTFGRSVKDVERAMVTLEVLFGRRILYWWEDEES